MPAPVSSALTRPLRAAALVLAVAAGASAVGAFPKPATVPFRWQLDFEAGELRLFEDPVEGAAFWYFTYQVVNETGRDQIWAPSFILFTDRGEILPSGEGVPSRVTEQLREMLGNELMETQNEVIGDLFQGEEHAKDGLVVWPARATNVNELSLFIAGLSGETARVLNPVDGVEVILRKTLQRDYLIPGDALARGSEPVAVTTEGWILR